MKHLLRLLRSRTSLTKLLRALKECAANLRIHLKRVSKPASGEKLFGLLIRA